MWTTKYVLLFILIQLVSIPLTLLGLPIIAILAGFKLWNHDLLTGKYHWKGGKLTWLWDNEEDGICPAFWQNPITPWMAFRWSALRNSCNDLRYIPGVSKPGRPMWYRTWTMFGKQFYAKAGWESNGYPSDSIGAGRGY